MEGAESHIVGTPPDKMHVIRHDLDYVGGILDALSCGLIDQLVWLDLLWALLI